MAALGTLRRYTGVCVAKPMLITATTTPSIFASHSSRLHPPAPRCVTLTRASAPEASRGLPFSRWAGNGVRWTPPS
eukprot:7018495-Prymnesium_polylepis.1